LCDSANGNKNNSEWGLCAFLKKSKNLFNFNKKQKNWIYDNRRVGFKKNGLYSSMTIFHSFFVIFP